MLWRGNIDAKSEIILSLEVEILNQQITSGNIVSDYFYFGYENLF